MTRTTCFILLLSLAAPLRADGLSAAAAAETMQKILVAAIARSEKSVVAIVRVRKEQEGDKFRLESRPDPFGRRLIFAPAPQPTDANFIPTEYAAGVVVDRRGLILTAYHVLGEDSEYYVVAHDRRAYRASVRAADPRSDMAVLSIAAEDLAPIALGDAAALRKGQIVLTLGNPYALARDGQPCAGWGIVSNLARKAPLSPDGSDATGRQTLHHFGTLIQTDAKLNLGVSGGPLLNLKGEMVGLCVALAAVAGCESSAGYAIPVDATFRRALAALADGREVEYGYLGVTPANLPAEEVLDAVGAGPRGVRVERVVPGSPAARCGLKTNDIITAVGDARIDDADALVLEVGRLPVEAAARLSVLRDGRPLSIRATLGKYPTLGKKIVTNRPPAWRGLRVDYASAMVESEQAVRASRADADDAVVVVEVEEGSAAARAGLRRGMLIARADGAPVRTPKEFFAAVAGKSAAVELRLLADDEDSVRRVAP